MKVDITKAIHDFKQLLANTKDLISSIDNDLNDIMNFDKNYKRNLYIAQYSRRKRIRDKYTKKLLK